MPTGSQSIYGQPGRYNVSLPTLNDGQGSALAVDGNGRLLMGTSTASIGSVSISQTTPGTTNAVSLAVKSGSATQNLVRDITQFGDGVTDGIAAVGQEYFRPDTSDYARWRGYMPFLYSRKTADGQVKATAGYINNIVVTPTAATSVSGTITIYDSATESGTVIQTIFIPTNNAATISMRLQVATTTGIFVGYDATVTNHAVTVSYV